MKSAGYVVLFLLILGLLIAAFVETEHPASFKMVIDSVYLKYTE